jgi:hypothetical protein
MSGMITVAIRKQTGETEFHTARSRFLLQPFTTDAFRNGDITPLIDHLMEEAKIRRSKRSNEIKWPSEDGIVFVDELEKTVLNWQTYATLTAVHDDEIGGAVFPNPSPAALERRARLATSIVDAMVFSAQGWVAVPDFKRPTSEAELVKEMERLTWTGSPAPGVPNMVQYVLDFPAWEFHELDVNNSSDLKLIRKAIEDAAPMTESDMGKWSKHFEDHFDAEDDKSTGPAKPRM